MNAAVQDASLSDETLQGHRGEWLPLGLPWRQSFWEQLRPLTLMRLNPHWNVEPGNEDAWDVEDVLVEKRFTADPEISVVEGRWSVRFPAAGLLLEAASRERGGDTVVRWNISQSDDPSGLLPAEAQRTVQYWLPSLREYYRLYESDGLKHRFWRMFMNKVMLTMNPAQRRICAFIFKFTMLELVLILALLVGYFQFIAK